MLIVRAIWGTVKPTLRFHGLSKRHLSTSIVARSRVTSPWSALRNVSFWGHIDAGKTTLTERVLYMAKALSPPSIDGQSSKSAGQLPGDVDSGSTVTDFLEAERQRGITIQSAAVGPFLWQPKEPLDGVPESKITLIDTPGHIDFTIEVERSLRVADGCVILIDGVEGMESQTESVWAIAKRYNVRSHVVFVNKLDRMGASLANSVKSILLSGIHKRPTILQLPIYQQESSAAHQSTLIGTIDLSANPVQAYFYGGRAGEIISLMSLEQAVKQKRVTEELYAEARRGREALVESLGSVDEELLNTILSLSSDLEDGANANDLVSTNDLRRAIRRQTIAGEILPVLCGSAQKEIGTQAVLDAINWYLPAPHEAGDMQANEIRKMHGGSVLGNVEDTGLAAQSTSSSVAVSLSDVDLSLLAFKVVYDKQKGPLIFVRIYSGSLNRSTTLFNTTTQSKERLSKILFAYADRFIEAETLGAGQVGVLIGLRNTRTGDTLVDNRAASISAKKKPTKDAPVAWASNASRLRLRRVHVPPPVFSVSLEPRGKADEAQVREALDMLLRTDPSLRIDYGEGDNVDGSGLGSAGTGQIVLSGMGELHLEIAKDRLLNEFNAKAVIGSVRVSYREALAGDAEECTWHTEELDREIMGKRLQANCEIGIRNLREDEVADDTLSGNSVTIDLGDMEKSQDDFETAQTRAALRAGIAASLSRGPLSFNAVMGVHIFIRNVETFGPQVSTSKALTMLASQGLNKALKKGKMTMMEPVMKVRIDCDDQYLGKVSSVLSSEQNGIVERVDHQVGKTDSSIDTSSIYLPREDDITFSQSDKERRGGIASTIHATVPLVKLVNYSSKLRAITKGTGIFEMALQGFTVASAEREREILSELGRL